MRVEYFSGFLGLAALVLIGHLSQLTVFYRRSHIGISGRLPPPDHAYGSTQITHQGVIRDGHRGNHVADYTGGYARARSLVSTHSSCPGCSLSPARASPPSPAAGSSYSEVADAWQIMP